MGILDLFKKKQRENNVNPQENEVTTKITHKWDITAEVAKLGNEKYVVRDDFKDKEYYINRLVKINALLNDVTERYESGTMYEPERYYPLVRRQIIDMIYLLYVLGAEHGVIKKYVIEYLSLLEKEDKRGWPYSIEVSVLALASLYDIETEKIAWVKSKMGQIKDKYVDAVLDVLRNKIFDDKLLTDKEFYFKETGIFSEHRRAKGGLVDVFNAKDVDTRTEKFVEYLTKVKEKHYKYLLKHYDEVGEERYTYYGSQCFKLTALAKILEIDKTKIASSRFIADDLL